MKQICEIDKMEEFWVPKPWKTDLKIEDTPRFLTNEEIEYILQGFPEVKSGDKDAATFSRNVIISRLRSILKYVVLDPSEIKEYRQSMFSRFLSSRIQEGDNIGVNGSNALGETVSQIALNTFHFSGSAGVMVNNISSLRTLLFGHRVKAGRFSIIMPKKRYNSFDEILSLRKELESLSIGDLLDVKSMDVKRMEEYDLEPWVHTFTELRNVRYDPRTFAMKIEVNLNKLLIYGITMEELSRLIKNDNNGINIIYSPLAKKTLYILAKAGNDEKIGELKEFQMKFFFRDGILPNLSKRYIRGIPLIEKIYPVSASVWDRSVKNIYREKRRSNLPPEAVKSFGLEKARSFYGTFWKVEVSLRRMYEFKLNEEGDNLFEQLLESLFLKYYFLENGTYYIYNPYSTENIDEFVHARKNGLPYITNYKSVFKKKEPKSILSFSPVLVKQENGRYAIFPTDYISDLLSLKKELSDEFTFGSEKIIQKNKVKCYEVIFDRRINIQNQLDWRLLNDEDYRQRVTQNIAYLKTVSSFDIIEMEDKVYCIFLNKFLKDKDKREMKNRGIEIENFSSREISKDVQGLYLDGDISKLKNMIKKNSKDIEFSDPEDEILKKYPYQIEIVEINGEQKFCVLIDEKQISMKQNIQIEVANILNNKGYGIAIRNSYQIYSYYDEDGNKIFTDKKSSYKTAGRYNGFLITNGAIEYHPQDFDLVNQDAVRKSDPTFLMKIEGKYYIFSRKGYIDTEFSDHMLRNGVKIDENDYIKLYFYFHHGEIVYSQDEPSDVDSYGLYGFLTEGEFFEETGRSKTNEADNDEELLKNFTRKLKDLTKATPYEKWYILSKDDSKIDTTKKTSFTDYDLLSNPHVDPLRTYSNSSHNICKILGVEATCYFLMNSLKTSVSASGNYIDPRHILLISDFILNRGSIRGVVFYGLSRQPIGYLSASTIERGMEVLKRHAPAGSKETISNVSSSIATGQYIKSGTKLFNIKGTHNKEFKIPDLSYEDLPEEIRKEYERDEEYEKLEYEKEKFEEEFEKPFVFESEKKDRKLVAIRTYSEVLLKQVIEKNGFEKYDYVKESYISNQIVIHRLEKQKVPQNLDKILKGTFPRREFVPLTERELAEIEEYKKNKFAAESKIETIEEKPKDINRKARKTEVPFIKIDELVKYIRTMWN